MSCAVLSLRPDISLAPLSERHAVEMLRWMQDPEVRENVGLRREPSLEATRLWIRRAQTDESVSASAMLRASLHVGNVVLDRIDAYLQMARLSVYIGAESERGAGVGTTGIYRKLADGFGPLGLHKVWLVVRCGNLRAKDAYLRLGFQIEGVLRDEFWYDGRRESVYYMGLLRDEFIRLPAA
jgi:RimJ/RimL family protein N-acetyltransferase